MARVELNIVALGDFKSINTQIANLKTQVESLNKSLSGVGINSNLSKQLQEANAAFKATMLSTGQFTSNTVALKTETEKFGEALATGKLKLTEYFQIIRAGSASATAQMKSLALEQTKLQNSIVMSDPTKQGVMSVYTPTKINEVANATKIATNMQNLYNIAVKKGTEGLINWGKNTQWAGRQLTVGMTVPLTIFGSTAMQTFKQVNDELVRLQKVYGTGLVQPSQAALDQIKNQVLGLSKELASGLGIAVKDTASMAADLAAVGMQGQDLINSTREAMRLQKLGEMSTQDAMQTTISLQNVYKLNTQQLSGAVNFLNAVENQTSTSLQDLAAGIPKVGPIVQQLGGSFKDTAVMMVAMKEAGVPAAQSANAIKSAIASLINPTTSAQKAFAAYNINLKSIASETGGNPVKMIMQLQSALKGLQPLAQAQLIEKLFGKFQEARIQALITNLGAATSQTKTAFELMNASDSQLAGIAKGELKTATESVTGKFQRAIETMKADLIPVGQEIMKIATKLLDFGNSVAKVFSGLPGPLKFGLGLLAGAVALSGPLIMLTGVLANFAGYIIKTVFSIKNLVNGTKTFGQLFTPEIIAAQNASQLFSQKILEDESAVSLLNKAVKELTMSLEAMAAAQAAASSTSFASTIAAVETGLANRGLKLPGMSEGGVVPGVGNNDSVPVLLTPGEVVIPKGEKGRSIFNAIKEQYGGLIPYTSQSGKQKSFRDREFAHLNSDKNLTDFTPEEQTNLRARSGIPSTVNASEIKVLDATGAMYHREINQLTNDGKLEAKKLVSYLKGIATEFTRGGMTRTLTHDPNLAYGHLMDDLGIVDKEARAKYAIELDKRLIARIEQETAMGATYISDSGGPGKIKASVMGEEFNTLANQSGYGTGATALGMPMELRSKSAKGSSNRYFLKGVEQRVSAMISAVFKGTRRMTPGSQAAEGLLSGNFIAGESAVSALSQIEKNTAKEINIESQSQSPSRVTKQAAKNMVDGVILGLKEGETRVTESMGSIGPGLQGGGFYNNPISSGPGLLGRVSARFNKFGAMGKMGAGMGLSMGGTALAGLLPQGSVLSGMAGSASTLGGLAMMLPGVGWGAAAAVAGIGVALSGIHSLMKAHQEHQTAVKATYTASRETVNMFGGSFVDQTPKIHVFAKEIELTNKQVTDLQKNVDAISKLNSKDSDLKKVADLIKGYNTAGSVVGTIQTFAAAQVANGMDPAKVKDMVAALLTYAGKTQYLNEALKNITKNTKDTTTATSTWLSSLKEQAGYIDQTITSYSQLTMKQKGLADAEYSVANKILDTNTGWQEAIKLAKTLQDSVGNTTQAFVLLEQAAKNANDINLSNLLSQFQSTMSIENALLVGKAAQKVGIKPGESAASIAAKVKGELIKENNVAIASNAAATATYNAQVEAAKKAALGTQQDALTLAKQDLKTAQDKLTVEQKTSNELKRQQDYLLSKTDIENQIKQATATGDYLKANQLRQQQAFATDQYNNPNKQTALQSEVDRLTALVDNLQAQKDKVSTATSAAATVQKPTLQPVLSDAQIAAIISGPGGLIDALNANTKALGGTPSDMPGTQAGSIKSVKGNNLQNAAIAAVSKGTPFIPYVNPNVPVGLSTPPQTTYRLFTFNGKTYATDQQTGSQIYNYDPKTKILGSKIKKFASGTPYVQSDGLAYLHKGERVVTAKDNQGGWLQKWSKSLDNMPAAEIMGTGPLLRFLSGRKKQSNWDYLGAGSLALGGAKGFLALPKLLKLAIPALEGIDQYQGLNEQKGNIASFANQTGQHVYNVAINIAKVDSSVDIQKAVNDAFTTIQQKQAMSGRITKVGAR